MKIWSDGTKKAFATLLHGGGRRGHRTRWALRSCLILAGLAGLALASISGAADETWQMASLQALHGLPLLGVAVFLVVPRRCTLFACVGGLLVFVAVLLVTSCSWAVEGYASMLGFGRASFTPLLYLAMALPALLLQTLQLRHSPSAPATRRTHFSLGGLVVLLYVASLGVFAWFNLADFQRNRWVYMYQSYVWPGLCCPCCAIQPRPNYSGVYRRWGYHGQLLERTPMAAGLLEGERTIFDDSSHKEQTLEWSNGVPHGVERSWRRGEELVAEGTWQRGKRWDGEFLLRGEVVVYRHGEEWAGKFPRYRTGSHGLRYRDGYSVLSNGIEVARVPE